MNKEELIAMGLTEEQAQKVIADVENNYVPKSQFSEINEENKTLKKSVSERDRQLEDLKKSSGDNESLKKQIEELQIANAEQKKTHDAEMVQLKLDNAVETALTAAGAKNNKAVRSLFDAGKLKLAADGSVEGLSDQLNAVRKSDPYLFNENQKEQQTVRNFKGFQPGASGDMNPSATIDTSKMTYSELAEYMAANPDVQI